MYAADFRRISRESLHGRWFQAVVAGLIATLVGAVGSNGPELEFELNGGNAAINVNYMDQVLLSTDDIGIRILQNLAGAFVTTAFLGAVLMILVGSAVEVGYARYNLNLVDLRENDLGVLFSYFSRWGTMIAAGFLRWLYILAWTLLLIIPGIIASYSYAMTPYILAENPGISANEAITRSKEMMSGNRFRLFCLEISFIGWQILCVFTFGIGYLWLTPYEQAARAAFYRDLTSTGYRSEY